MGLDLSIEARIREKETGRIVTVTEREEYLQGFREENLFDECFEVCYWRKCYDVRHELIEIAKKHGGTVLKGWEPDFAYVLPAEAFEEIYGYLIRRSLLHPGEEQESIWGDLTYQAINLENAQKVLNLLQFLKKEIKYPFLVISEKSFLTDEDYQAFCENPEAYEWEFFISNSY